MSPLPFQKIFRNANLSGNPTAYAGKKSKEREDLREK